MKTMNRILPVILVLMLLTGSLVDAHSPQYSEKLRLGPKKNFSRVQEKSGSGKVGYIRGVEPPKGTIAPGTLVDPYGYITSYGYDGYDRISRITDPLNNVTLIGRSNTGNLLSLKQLDPTGQQILLQSIRINDPAGRLTSYTVKMPNPDDDIKYTITYEENGKKVIFKDPLERQTIVEKNDDGKVSKVTDAANNVTEYFYEDGRGNVTKKEETVKSADGTKTETYFTEYKYNAHNQVETITDVQTGAVTTFTYDLKGNLTGTIDAEGNTITHEYDELGRRIKTKQHFTNTSLKPVETTFEYYPTNIYNSITKEGEYSPSNRLKSITDDKGNKTTYEYDYRNRLKKIIYPDLTFTEYTYDKTATGGTNSSGNPTYYRLVVEKQRNVTVVTNYYDQLQRLMKREIAPAEGAAGTTIETFTYDELSRIKTAADDDTGLRFEFDRANRLDWEKQGNRSEWEMQTGKLIDYTYNKLSNLTDLKYPNTKLIEMQYDQLNRMNLIKEDDFTIADMNHIGRSYRLLRKQYGNGDLITYLYDKGRRLEYLESKNKAGGIINHYRYGYNKINLKTFEQRLHNAGKGDVLGYDALYRLTNIKFNVPDPTILNPTEFEKERSINYNNLHSIISIVENFNGQTRTIDTEIPDGSDYSKLNQYARFDQWGLEYDRNGNVKQKGTQRFTHDYRNQLISAVDGTLSVEMKYDVMGRRVQKAVTKGNQTEVRNYYYAGHQLIEERDGNDQVTRQYIYGNGIDEIIRMDKYEGTDVTSYYFHTDSIGSITEITDSQGNLVERVTYDTYGMPTFWDPAGNKIPESLIGNTILFQGREYDPELNLYYYRARYYDPIMGRFLETDPMGYADSMNLYQGFNMNPANFTDPLGLWNWFKMAGSYWEEMARNPIKTIGTSVTDILENNCNIVSEGVHESVNTAKGFLKLRAKFIDHIDEDLAKGKIIKREKFKHMVFAIELSLMAYGSTEAPANTPKNVTGGGSTSTSLVHYETFWKNMPKVLDYRSTAGGYVAVTADAGYNTLTSGNNTTLTLNQVRNLRGEQRWQAAEQYVQELYGSNGQRHFEVPAQGQITGSGGRFVDAPVDTSNGVLANEVKIYQQWRTIQGRPTQSQVPLSEPIQQQILKDVWLRQNTPGFDPRWVFLDANPSVDLASFLNQNNIPYIVYR